MIPSTVSRVPLRTATCVNEKIRRQTERNVAWYGSAGPEALEERLRELDEEWDIERVLEASASSTALLGFGLGMFGGRRFFALPLAVAGFLLQHAVQGWCPPLPILRRMGFRTQSEIEQERYALKALRGDFRQFTEGLDASQGSFTERVMAAVRN